MKAEQLLREAKKLTLSQRSALAHEIWLSVEEENAEPVSAELKKELDRRWARHEKKPSSGTSWEDVKAELKKRRRARKRKLRA